MSCVVCNALPCVVCTDSSYVGCFQEPQDVITGNAKRPLAFIQDSANMTVKMCKRLALDKLYAYAGVQYGSQCYGGNNISMYLNIKCITPCPGNNKTICGGNWINSIYNLTGEAPCTLETAKSLCTVCAWSVCLRVAPNCMFVQPYAWFLQGHTLYMPV